MSKLRVKVMREDVFDSLPEYSMTMPTGLPVGKRWRRCEEWVEHVPMADGMARMTRYRWLVATVTREIDDRHVEIQWRFIVLTDGKATWLP